VEKELVRDRLRKFIDSKGGKVLAFEKTLDTRSTIQNYLEKDSNLGIHWFTKIFEVYPELSVEWLMTGKGDMLVGSKTSNLIEAMEFIKDNAEEASQLKSFESFLETLTLLIQNVKLREKLKALEEESK